eukprot:COSAG02_NODE_28102_length_596_cov_1.008048_1_plen_189_part_00
MLRPRHTGKEAVQILHTCTRTGLRPVDRPKDLWWGIPVLPPEVLERIELHQEFTLKRRRNPIWQSAPVSALQGFSYDRNTLCCTALYCVSSVQLIALCAVLCCSSSRWQWWRHHQQRLKPTRRKRRRSRRMSGSLRWSGHHCLFTNLPAVSLWGLFVFVLRCSTTLPPSLFRHCAVIGGFLPEIQLCY